MHGHGFAGVVVGVGEEELEGAAPLPESAGAVGAAALLVSPLRPATSYRGRVCAYTRGGIGLSAYG